MATASPSRKRRIRRWPNERQQDSDDESGRQQRLEDVFARAQIPLPGVVPCLLARKAQVAEESPLRRVE